MTRTFTTAEKNVIAGDFTKINLIELDVPSWNAAPFTNGILSFNTSALDFIHDGKTYYGADGIVTLDSIKETSEIKRNGLSIGFSGLNTSLLNLFLTDTFHINKVVVSVFEAAYVQSGFIEYQKQYVKLIHKGKIDNIQYKTSSESAQITVRTTSVFSDWARPRLPFLDDSSQRERNSNDKSLSFLGNTVNQQVTWGNG